MNDRFRIAMHAKRDAIAIAVLLYSSALPASNTAQTCSKDKTLSVAFDAIESVRVEGKTKRYAGFIVKGPRSGEASIALRSDVLVPMFDGSRARLYMRDKGSDWYSFDLASYAETDKWLSVGRSSRSVVYFDISNYVLKPAAAQGKEFMLEISDRAGCSVQSSPFPLDLPAPAR